MLRLYIIYVNPSVSFLLHVIIISNFLRTFTLRNNSFFYLLSH